MVVVAILAFVIHPLLVLVLIEVIVVMSGIEYLSALRRGGDRTPALLGLIVGPEQVAGCKGRVHGDAFDHRNGKAHLIAEAFAGEEHQAVLVVRMVNAIGQDMQLVHYGLGELGSVLLVQAHLGLLQQALQPDRVLEAVRPRAVRVHGDRDTYRGAYLPGLS